MKRKEYMRGMGIGILITAILCAVALPEKKEMMTDAEIIARAKELGYVKEEGGVTAEDINKIKENGKNTGTPTVSTEPEISPELTPESPPENTPGPTPSPVPTPEPPDAPDQPKQPASPTPVSEITGTQEKEIYTIKIERGATSYNVAEQLKKIGAIPDVTAFVTYLKDSDLAGSINIGTFRIPKGSDYAEIAHILTGK